MTDRTINITDAEDIVRHECGAWTGLAETIVRKMKKLPDAIPVVRCGDCIRYHPDDEVWGWCTVAGVAGRMRRKDYCSYGVRKDGDEHDNN